MSIALVSTVTKACDSTAQASLATAAFNCAAGNFLYIGMETNSTVSTGSAPSAVSGIADTAGNSFTFLKSLTRTGTNSNGIACWICWNCLGNANNVVTISFSPSITYTGFTVRQYSGVKTSANPFDQFNTGGGAGSSASATTGSFTPSAAGSVAIELGATDGAVTYTLDANYANQDTPNSSGVNICSVGDRIGAPASAQTASMSVGSAETNWALLVTNFLAAAATPSGNTNQLMMMGCGT